MTDNSHWQLGSRSSVLTQRIAPIIADSGGLQFIPKEAQSYLKGKAGCCRSNEVVHSQFV